MAESIHRDLVVNLSTGDDGDENSICPFLGDVTDVFLNVYLDKFHIPHTPTREVFGLINDVAFGMAHETSDGYFTVRDGFQLAGGLALGGAGAAAGSLFGGPVLGLTGGMIGGELGGHVGGSVYDVVDAKYSEMYTPRPDPAGGSGVAGFPGSARVPGYSGRFDDGVLRAGDELNALDALAEIAAQSGQTYGPFTTGSGSGDGSGGSGYDPRGYGINWGYNAPKNDAPNEDHSNSLDTAVSGGDPTILGFEENDPGSVSGSGSRRVANCAVL